MNTNKLKAYAPQARREFIQAVTDRAKRLGLSKDETEPIDFKGDLALIGGQAFPKKIGDQRNDLEKIIKKDGFDRVMEAMAYTWFNRFMALRYMELHDYLDHGYRVLSNRADSDIPEILENAVSMDLEGLDKKKAAELRLARDKDNELYRLLIIAQCNALHRALPFLFERVNHATELLLPDNLLHSNSPIRKMVDDIDEADWNEVEIIGWIYQFYISEKKDQVIGKVVKSEDIPAATQLFTPNWIVKYMVQNTLGRKWLATYPDSPLRQKMEYYIEPAKQEPEVQAQLDVITPEELNPEEITFLDPACGSGHILVEAYEIYKEIYLERGYRTRDIPKLILEKNLYGLEIDERAAQMAGFALMMRARRDDRRILSREEPLKLNVLALQSSQGINADEIANILGATKKEKLVGGDTLFDDLDIQPSLEISSESKINKDDIEELIDLFEHAKTFGSLIQVPDELGEKLHDIGQAIQAEDKEVFQKMLEPLKTVVSQAEILVRKYDCVLTNPPYMGSKGLNGILKAYAKENFPNSKSDLFSIFVERIMKTVKEDGGMGFMTPFTWMFLSSYEKLRFRILTENTLTSLIRPEYHAFFESAYVPICSFTLMRKPLINYRGAFIDLQQFYGVDIQKIKALEAINNKECGWFYLASAVEFNKIPGSPIAFWVSNDFLDCFSKNKSIGELIDLKAGISTGDNYNFQRHWWEVSINDISFSTLSVDDTKKNGITWYPCHSGGEYRKWFGNHDIIVNWKDNGYQIRNFGKDKGKIRSAIRNESFYFKSGITWSKISSSYFAARWRPVGFLFDDTGRCGFSKSLIDIRITLAFFCSILSNQFLKVLCPTLSFTSGELAKLPFINVSSKTMFEVIDQLVEITKTDWDSNEISWEFNGLYLLQFGHLKLTVEDTFKQLRTFWKEQTIEMQRLEEENNRIFIHAYGLQDELTPDVPLKEITLTCNPHYRYNGDKSEEELEELLLVDTIKELISYSIGCMMGRYSLDEPGLIYAHSGNEGFNPSRYKTFPTDDDGIVPIMDQDWFPDDATNRFKFFLRQAWSLETLDENLQFVADALKPKRGESAVDTIRRYMSTSFFKDHLKTYKKRPIYWLFSSGKQKAFECLVYLHRYNESTLSRMRSSYVTPLQGKFNARMEYLKSEIDAAAFASSQKKFENELNTLKKKQAELNQFDEELRHYADMRIKLGLDDGVKVNYGKFGNLLAERKAVTGEKK